VIQSLVGVVMQKAEDPWVARCRAGDVEAFGELYAQYQPLIFRFAYRMLGNREDADDIGQETFVRAYQAVAARIPLRQLNGPGGPAVAIRVKQ
jgi:DNA-directed RNA polymerase specialized sigma24 family protein